MTRRQSRQFNRRSLVSKKLSMPVIPEVAPGSSDVDVELSFKPISISAESSRETEEREKMREEQVRQNLINKQKQLEREAAEGGRSPGASNNISVSCPEDNIIISEGASWAENAIFPFPVSGNAASRARVT
eukprot:237302_1